MTAHLITSVMGSEKKILTKCGETLKYKPLDGMPAGLTGWASKVDCAACLKAMAGDSPD